MLTFYVHVHTFILNICRHMYKRVGHHDADIPSHVLSVAVNSSGHYKCLILLLQ